MKYCQKRNLKKSLQAKGYKIQITLRDDVIDYYITIDSCVITVNSSSYTIITAHRLLKIKEK